MTTLYAVKWTNVWNRSAANNRDGAGTHVHLTDSAAVRGTTLCGKTFPADKGYASSIRFCKRCIKKAYATGHPQGFTKGIEWVRSVDDE